MARVPVVQRQQFWACRRVVIAALRAAAVTFKNCPKVRTIAETAWRVLDNGKLTPAAPKGKGEQRYYLVTLAAHLLPTVAGAATAATTKPMVRVLPDVDPRTPEFLLSRAWRTIRYQAIKQHGARCQCCGSGREQGRVINVDHIQPRKLRPDLALDLTNLQVLCDLCNAGKGNWDATDWRSPAADLYPSEPSQAA